MYQRATARHTRSAFTLVELMVVILIISILSALLVMAVSRGIAAAKRTRNMVEIRQLAAAVDAFKTAYKVDYIPSKLYLSETGTYIPNIVSIDPIGLVYISSCTHLAQAHASSRLQQLDGSMDGSGPGV